MKNVIKIERLELDFSVFLDSIFQCSSKLEGSKNYLRMHVSVHLSHDYVQPAAVNNNRCAAECYKLQEPRLRSGNWHPKAV
ncbi:hypothetical protein SLEP1_g27816 [Rubroshorea leprosula]|uniref:Uncharacterized protein n=1 Tax=Rubroshorea leprosula TaxID=152421 RepID=A0AAV5JRK9_9ROSI|nr:hypothetical protein SLEP1_g27816 [Rubroshorea leprosula]